MTSKDTASTELPALGQNTQQFSKLNKTSSRNPLNDIGWPESLLSILCQHVLPLRGVRITLRATKEVHTRFQHTHALSAWVRSLARDGTDDTAANSGFDQLRIDAVESGHVYYAPGDHYQFSILSTAKGLPVLARVLDRLAYPRHVSVISIRSSDAVSLAFGEHWELHAVIDWFSGKPVSGPDQLALFDAGMLLQEAAIWQEACVQTLVWQWLSPARVLKRKDKRGKGENRFCRDAGDIDAALLLERCADTLGHLARTVSDSVPTRDSDVLPAISEQHHDVFWVQDDYHPANAEAKPKGGLLGRHRLHIALPRAWACVIVLGQYLGIGQSTASGLGRFRLESSDGKVSFHRGHSQRTWLDRSLEPANLLDAWRHVRESRQSIPLDARDLWDEETEQRSGARHAEQQNDNVSAIEFTEPASLLDILNWRMRALREGRYTPPAANAMLLPKSDGGSRMLAIPPIWDAVLQRAVAQRMSPALDSLMHPASFGYRRGRSRRSAAEVIQRARREGYRWIYDADIEDFFGSVNHDRLHGRLLALFDDDPIIDVLMNWIRAPVRWEGVDHPRKQGLPQGSNLSPLLANLMLDDFDNDMSAAGIRLVRFADDFVLLCKSREQAEEASRAAARSLEEHGFFLHKDKSRVTDLDAGLEFLGYLFINDYAIDTSANRVLNLQSSARSGKRIPLSTDQSLQMAHWLSKISQQRPRSLTTRELEAREAGKVLARVGEGEALAIDEQFDPDGSIYLVGHGHLIYTEGGHVVVARDDERIMQRPWQHLRHLFLMGNQHITTPALRVAAREGVNVYVTSATGSLQFNVTAPATPADQRLWLRQAVIAEDADFCVPIARKIVASRIRHQVEVLRLKQGNEADSRMGDTTKLLRQLSQSDELTTINGLEGRAAAVYFEQFSKLIPEHFGFTSRQRRPPPDPVNALLSIGYQLLYANADTFLRAERLLPAFGVYHRAGRNHAALASDMIEPFRHLVEQSVLLLLRRNSLKAEDFSIQADGQSCLVLPAARRRFIADLQSRLGKPIKPRGEFAPMSHRMLLHRQCHSIALAIEQRDPEQFHAFRKR